MINQHVMGSKDLKWNTFLAEIAGSCEPCTPILLVLKLILRRFLSCYIARPPEAWEYCGTDTESEADDAYGVAEAVICYIGSGLNFPLPR